MPTPAIFSLYLLDMSIEDSNVLCCWKIMIREWKKIMRTGREEYKKMVREYKKVVECKIVRRYKEK